MTERREERERERIKEKEEEMNTMHLSGKLFQLYAAAAIQLGGMQSGWSIVGDRDAHCSFDILSANYQ